jgi:hypothetical protein
MVMFDTRQRVPRRHQDRPGRPTRRWGPDGLGGRPAFVVLAAIVVLLARDAAFRDAVRAFIRSL